MAKASTTRFTVSLPDQLMDTLDRLRSERGYGNRSEFVRDLLRGELVKEEWTEQRGETVGVVLLVYDHHTRLLADRLTDIQHGSFRDIAAALHIHLDAHTCLEVIALRGAAKRIRTLADSLMSVKGVRYGKLMPATTGKGMH